MFKNISLGIYYPGDTLLHRLQARTKLLIMLTFIVYIVIANQNELDFVPYIAAVLLLFTGIALAGVSPRFMWQRMRILVILALISAIPAIFYPDSQNRSLATLGPLPFSYGLLRTILLIYMVIVTIYLLVLLLPLPTFRTFRQRRWFRGLRVPLIILTVIVVFIFLAIRRSLSASTFLIGPLHITPDGIWILMSVLLVFLLLYALSLLLTMTTSPIALIEGMTILLSPLRRLKLPVDDFALMTLIAFRFIPTLIEEAEQLVKAQTSRGASFTHGKLAERIQSLTALFIPFLQGSFRRASDLATALEARGYEVDGRQTPLHEKSFGMVDFVVFGTMVIVMVGALVL